MGSVSNQFDVSVIISTHNRCEMLPATLKSVLTQDPSAVSYEVIAVDNNSTDRTREAIQALIAEGHTNLRHLFEPEQGVSYGRNAGIRIASAPILAFTDDDVLVERDWVANIKRAFDENPDIDYVTGRMLPHYEDEPPTWLTQINSSPVVLRDRGDKPIYSTPGHFFPGWATANIAYRREVFERVGLFSGDFPRGQDLEFIVRLWRANGRGMYAPDVAVTHKIPAERMTKAYHRMWHTREGDIRSRIGFKEIFDADGKVRQTIPDMLKLFGVPAFMYREMVIEVWDWLAASARRRKGLAFHHENMLRQTISYMRSRFKQNAAVRKHSHLAEIGGFAKALISSRWQIFGSGSENKSR